MSTIKKGDCFESTPKKFVEVTYVRDDCGTKYIFYVEKSKNYLNKSTSKEREIKYSEFEKRFGANQFLSIGITGIGGVVIR